jgi:AhpD family alkylhydroperoxidase
MSKVLSGLTRRAILAQVRHVRPVHPAAARGLVARVYAQLQQDFGMLAPPVVLHSPAPQLLAGCWLMLRETLLAGAAADRVAKETAAAAVSLANTCPYCVDVHSATWHGLSGDPAALALASGATASISDPSLRALAAWARASGTRAGAAAPAPFPPERAAELIGVAVTFHYLNRMVNVFLAESPFPAVMPAAARRGAWRLFGRIMRPAASRGGRPGSAVDLLPPAPLPEDLAWAGGSATIGPAFARAAAAAEAAGTRSVPEPVRHLVRAQLDRWDGRPPGLSRSWVDTAVAALPPATRPSGRLALLTAFASYQVDQSVIDEFRAGGEPDAALVELCGWASLAAARQIGGWLSSACAPSAGRPEAARGGDPG